MTLFPVFANLKNRDVLVVGGGVVAERKVKGLLKAGARVTVNTLAASDALHELHRNHDIKLQIGPFDPALLDAAWLIVAASDDDTLHRALALHAERERIFINVVDDAELSTYHVPSIVDRSPLIIAISSGGTAPVFARRIRERIERMLDPSLGALATLVAGYRGAIRQARQGLRARREFYDWLMDGPVAHALKQQQPEQAVAALGQALTRPEPPTPGRVIVVGAGPGDPGLLTLNALRALNEADVILVDRLVSAEVRELARRDAQQIEVGKRPGEDHDATQTRIHQLMLHYAQQGQIVVRLKGGDPFIFGRGGEELEFLRAHDINYSVVPGITAAFASATYAGVPLTHRDHAASVRLLSACHRAGKTSDSWKEMAQSGETLTFYMGASRLTRLGEQLITHGMSPDTPFALVQNATRHNQRTLYGSLGTLSEQAATHAIASPSLLIVGAVAGLGPKLQWFGSVCSEPSLGRETRALALSA